MKAEQRSGGVPSGTQIAEIRELIPKSHGARALWHIKCVTNCVAILHIPTRQPPPAGRGICAPLDRGQFALQVVRVCLRHVRERLSDAATGRYNSLAPCQGGYAPLGLLAEDTGPSSRALNLSREGLGLACNSLRFSCPASLPCPQKLLPHRLKGSFGPHTSRRGLRNPSWPPGCCNQPPNSLQAVTTSPQGLHVLPWLAGCWRPLSESLGGSAHLVGGLPCLACPVRAACLGRARAHGMRRSPRRPFCPSNRSHLLGAMQPAAAICRYHRYKLSVHNPA